MKLIEVGDSAPDFSLKDNRDQIISLSNYRGKRYSYHGIHWSGQASALTK